MPKSLAQLREQLSDIEPTDRTYEGIGPAEVDRLVQLLGDEEEWLAARAVHALSRIDSDDAKQAVVSAAENPRMEVRAAAAVCAAELPPRASDGILSRLLDDPQPAVRKLAIKSTSGRNSEAVKRRVAEIAEADVNSRLQRMARDQQRTISPP